MLRTLLDDLEEIFVLNSSHLLGTCGLDLNIRDVWDEKLRSQEDKDGVVEVRGLYQSRA